MLIWDACVYLPTYQSSTKAFLMLGPREKFRFNYMLRYVLDELFRKRSYHDNSWDNLLTFLGTASNN